MKLKMNMILELRNFFLLFIIIISPFSLNAKPIEAKIAEIRILDKITAKVKNYEIPINTILKTGSLSIQIYACYTTLPEEVPEDYALLRIYDYLDKKNNKLIYQGWMISSSPSSTPLEHPIYDLWIKDCKIDKDF